MDLILTWAELQIPALATSLAWKIGRWNFSAVNVWIQENGILTQGSSNLLVYKFYDKFVRFVYRANDP